MKHLFNVKLIFCLVSSVAIGKDWNQIVPCVSTRSDVERMLGRDELPIIFGSYQYMGSRVSIRYQQSDKNSSDLDLIEKIDVYPNKTIIFAKYRKGIRNFDRHFVKTVLDDRLTHVSGRTVYRNWKEGFEIWVHKNENNIEVVNSFGYFDPSWDCAKRSTHVPPR
jgi:hypothetical protein